MSRRNFILLIIVLFITVAVIFGFLFFRKPTTPPDDGTGTNFGSQFNPFGSNPNKPPAVTPPVDVSGYQPNPANEVKFKLRKVSSMPIAGFTVFQKERLKDVPPPLLVEEGAGGGANSTPPIPSGTPPQKGGDKVVKPTPPQTEFMPALRYVSRADGNIYQTFADKLAERKFSSTVIPKIYEALFGNNGDTVIMRYLKGDNKTIQTFVGNLPKEILGGDSTENIEVKGSFLPDDVTDISLSPDTTNVLYLVNIGDATIGTVWNLKTNKKTQIFESSFNEWLSFFPNNKMITLTTKASGGVPGYVYAVDTTNKTGMSKILGNISGLTTLANPDGKQILYGDSSLSLGVYHTDSLSADQPGVRTLPEKCVWGREALYCAVPKSIPGGTYPDSWYQGETTFSDQIWKIDLKAGTANILVDPSTTEGGESIDGIKLMLDAGENYLFFVNKKDSFLWELNLTQN